MRLRRRVKTGPRQAVSLVEILVVVAIIGLLIGMFLPSVMRARRQTKRTVCMAYAYQMGRASSRQNIRMCLEAMDCGCYGELNKDLGIYSGYFTLPEGMDEETYRADLERQLAEAE